MGYSASLSEQSALGERELAVRRFLILVGTLLSVFGTNLFASAAQGSVNANTNILTISGTVTATSSAGTSIVSGDQFTWSVSFDLDEPSTNEVASYATWFDNSVVAFSLSRNVANTGTWDPSTATWPISPVLNFVTNSNGNNMTVQLQPTGASPINTVPVLDVRNSLGWQSSVFDAVWTEGPTTLGTWFTTNTPPMSQASTFFEIRDANFNSPTLTMSIDRNEPEPEPEPNLVTPTTTPPTTIASTTNTTEAQTATKLVSRSSTKALPQTGGSSSHAGLAMALILVGSLVVLIGAGYRRSA